MSASEKLKALVDYLDSTLGAQFEEFKLRETDTIKNNNGDRYD